MRQLGIMIAVLLLAGGIYWMATQETNAPSNTDNETATTTDSVSSSTDTDVASSDNTSPDYCAELKNNIAGSEGWTIITNITNGSTISAGDEIRGCVYSVNGSYGGWAPFEGQIGYYEIIADDETLLTQLPLPTVENWMELGLAGEPIQYTTTLDFSATGYTAGTLVLHNENAAGIPELDRSIEISVLFE